MTQEIGKLSRKTCGAVGEAICGVSAVRHPVRSRLPEELWAAAAKLARRDGIEATALALGVDRPSLQEVDGSIRAWSATKTALRPARQRQLGRREHTAPAFVELLAQTTAATLHRDETSCLVEVESAAGCGGCGWS